MGMINKQKVSLVKLAMSDGGSVWINPLMVWTVAPPSQVADENEIPSECVVILSDSTYYAVKGTQESVSKILMEVPTQKGRVL
jgi:hypothetical protein